MSVESIHPSTVVSLFQQSSFSAAGSTPVSKEFEAILQQIGTDQSASPLTTEQALIQLKMTQVRMMQGLFSSSVDAEAPAPLFNLTTAAPFRLLDAQKGQLIDKYRRNLTPLHQSPSQVDRDQIEMLIDRVAEKIKLAPELIRAVVAVESSFNPLAVSPVGAQGLMQLMPATAADLGVKDSFDPLQNLLGGSRYLSRLLNKYDGDLDRALAAYNWGQGNVDRQGLEKMPAETRNYLVKIKGLLRESARV